MRHIMAIERDNEALRVRFLSHSMIFPITRVFWRVKQILRDLETIAVEWWVTGLTTAWALCLLLPGRGPFEEGGRPYETMREWGNEEVWGTLTALMVGLTLAGKWRPVMRVGRAAFRPQVAAYLVGAILYFGMFGAFGYQSMRIYSTWCAFSVGLLCMFLCWRKASE